MSDELTITRAAAEDWPVFQRWAAYEGWNPAPADGPCFRAQDPDGFFLGRIDGMPVSAVSVVNHGDAFSFLGFYLVHPEYRGRGHGYATWKAAVPHAGSRTIGLDGVVAQQDNYRKSGFDLAYRNIRYYGETEAGRTVVDSSVRPAAEVGFDAIAAYDARCYPAERPAFLERWLTAPGHVARAVVGDDGRVAGYGVIRPGLEFARIGPLFADTRRDAEALFDGLIEAYGGGAVGLDVPEANAEAVALVEARGLKATFETARMYTGPIREVELGCVYGVTSLELG